MMSDSIWRKSGVWWMRSLCQMLMSLSCTLIQINCQEKHPRKVKMEIRTQIWVPKLIRTKNKSILLSSSPLEPSNNSKLLSSSSRLLRVSNNLKITSRRFKLKSNWFHKLRSKFKVTKRRLKCKIMSLLRRNREMYSRILDPKLNKLMPLEIQRVLTLTISSREIYLVLKKQSNHLTKTKRN